MTHYTVCCGYASHYHNTVTVESLMHDVPAARDVALGVVVG